MGGALDQLRACIWPASRLPEAFAKVSGRTGASSHAPADDAGDEALNDWIEATAVSFQMETEPATLPYSGLVNSLRVAGPALLRVGTGFIVLLPKGRVLRPDLKVRRARLLDLASAMCEEMEAPIAGEAAATVESAGIPPRRRARAQKEIIRERLRSRQIGGCWLLRLPPGSDFRRQLRQAGVPQRLAALAASHLTQYVLFIASWWILGSTALRGRTDSGWLFAWALLLLTIVPFRMLTAWLQGDVAIRAGASLKQRLLYGALRLEPDEIRSEGAGQLLGRVLESQQVEALALSGGFLALVAGIELLLAIAVLLAGGQWEQAVFLVASLAVTALIASRYLTNNNLWTTSRLEMTHDLIEKMVGHRTRIAQQRPEHWHAGEDDALERYHADSRTLDRAAARLAIMPRAWLFAGVLALAPRFVWDHASTAQLAIAIGGMLLGYRALRRLTGGLWQLAGAAIAWRRTAALFHAAARQQTRGEIASTNDAADRDGGDLFEAARIVFRYRENGEPVLRGCSLRIDRGDRLLLEGPSGGGKSTLAAIVAGMRTPQSGAVLLNGLDRACIGAGKWRRSIVSAPQFHENHVLTGTLAFNLMMGARWPPRVEDFNEMETICRELGLGELLERMPAGLLQCVGDTGWQLSHGERSRLYIARALLQKPELVVLDESFAALDPENLRRAVDCVLARSRTVMVIAHP